MCFLEVLLSVWSAVKGTCTALSTPEVGWNFPAAGWNQVLLEPSTSYILDGIMGWNAACSASAALVNKDKTLHTFNTRLHCKVHMYIIYTQAVLYTCIPMHRAYAVNIPTIHVCYYGQCSCGQWSGHLWLKQEGLGSIPSGFPGLFFSSSWLSNVYGMKTLWCSSTVQLLSAQIWMSV